MSDLNKIRDNALDSITQDLETRQTDPLTQKDKATVKNLLDQAMSAPVRNSGMIDDFTDYVLQELEQAAYQKMILLQPEELKL